MNIFTTDHPLTPEPKEHPLFRSLFTAKALMTVLILSVVAEAFFSAGFYLLSESNFFSILCGAFHTLGLMLGFLIVPDAAEDYANKNQKFVFDCIVIVTGGLQWFLILIAGRFFLVIDHHQKGVVSAD